MEPPRIPLHPVNRQNTLLPIAGSKDRIFDPLAATKPSKPPPRLIPSELMDEFKKAVDGNDLTKVGLLEVLKKQYVFILPLPVVILIQFRFPKQPKDAIRYTLESVAERVGSKATEKKWILKPDPNVAGQLHV